MTAKKKSNVKPTKKAPTKKLKEDSIKRFQIRVDSKLTNEIDKMIEDSQIPISRNTWIVEAIVEHLKRERKKAK